MKKLLLSLVAPFIIAHQLMADSIENHKSQSFDYIDCMFLDVLGSPKSITLPIEKAEQACKSGIFFDGSSIIGFTSIHESDLLAKPDLTSLFVLPLCSEQMNTAIVMCDVCHKDGSLHPDSPRTVLKNTLDRAYEVGFMPYCGVEVEFYLLKKNINGKNVQLDDYGYCEAIPNYELKAFQLFLMNALSQAGIDIEKIHHEVAPGQYEVVIKYDDPLKIADALIMTKYIIQAVAEAYGLQATFMPKPFAHHNGSGMHIHMSFFDIEAGINAFYDSSAKNNLSLIAQQFIAGNLNRLRQSELLLNFSVNSFKRLVPGYEAPVYLCWGNKNRSAALRIPDINPSTLEETNGAPMRVEFRIPDATCNPYLAFAALIEAGIQGIINQEEAPDSVEKNLYHYSQEEIQELGIVTISTSLGEAIDEYKNSAFVQGLLGYSLYRKLLTIKEHEWNTYSKNETHNVFVITNWEKSYHDILD